MFVPQLTEEQRAQALEKAKEARKKRSETLKKLANEEITVEDVLSSDDAVIKKTKVLNVIKALPGYGKAKAEATMAELDIAEGRRIGGLGVRQKEALIQKLAKK